MEVMAFELDFKDGKIFVLFSSFTSYTDWEEVTDRRNDILTFARHTSGLHHKSDGCRGSVSPSTRAPNY